MPDGTSAPSTARPADEPDSGSGRVLMLIIVSGSAMLDDLVTSLLDIGVAGTVIESKGLMALLREEMPIFGGLASLMPQATGSTVVMSATTRDLAGRVFDVLEDEFRETERPIAFTVPIERLAGLRR